MKFFRENQESGLPEQGNCTIITPLQVIAVTQHIRTLSHISRKDCIYGKHESRTAGSAGNPDRIQ